SHSHVSVPPATATTAIYTLSLHDALPISSSAASRTPSRSGHDSPGRPSSRPPSPSPSTRSARTASAAASSTPRPSPPVSPPPRRSEEHTSELQSRENLVCRLLLEKKKKKN